MLCDQLQHLTDVQNGAAVATIIEVQVLAVGST